MATDVALINGGGVRTDRVVPPGPLTKRDVDALLPFTNPVMTLEMSGARLRDALEQGLAQVERQGGGFLQVSGLRLVWDPRRPPGARLVSVTVDGAPLDPARSYTVAVIDYLVRGGDGMTAFGDARVLVNEASGPPLAELVLGAITEQGAIAPAVEGRIERRAD
jgi:2',3'-cyclic-nucleotide 2'-phosphodiesterase (5'-nucleotidase family)